MFIAGIPRTCEDEVSTELLMSQNVSVEIDPDGPGGVDPFNVTCVMNGKYLLGH